jgi:hypothetical protein
MMQNSYDLATLLAKSELWRIEAARATSASMRAFCLNEAALCEWKVSRSIAVPIISDAADFGQPIAAAALSGPRAPDRRWLRTESAA